MLLSRRDVLRKGIHVPYKNLPPRNFWKTGMAGSQDGHWTDLYRKKFEITAQTKVATAGSCFAQHITRALRRRGCTVLDEEPPPRGLIGEAAAKYGYGLYSARYGNIYCVRHLLQLTQEAYRRFAPHDAIWCSNGRYFDALRPSVEPHGLKSPDTVQSHRADHLRRLKRVIEGADVFVFTLGLTESWIENISGTTYPTAPGTIAGEFDSDLHSFKNFTFQEIYMDFLKFRDLARAKNPTIKFLLTVSPVPLTATATDKHILCATTYSKSVLRAVAGQLSDEFSDVDYFPSYEIIASPAAKGSYYEANLRTVTSSGVARVMSLFFEAHSIGDTFERPTEKQPATHSADGAKQAQDVICEEALLEAFAR